jgi:hypothetical protein
MDEPFDPSTVKRLIEKILEFGSVIYPPHARQRMRQRAIDLQDMENVLRAGVPKPGEHHVTGAWRYKVETSLMCVVVEFSSEEELVVVTGWRNDVSEVKK